MRSVAAAIPAAGHRLEGAAKRISVAAEPTSSRDRNEHLHADLVDPPRDRKRLVLGGVETRLGAGQREAVGAVEAEQAEPNRRFALFFLTRPGFEDCMAACK